MEQNPHFIPSKAKVMVNPKNPEEAEFKDCLEGESTGIPVIPIVMSIVSLLMGILVHFGKLKLKGQGD